MRYTKYIIAVVISVLVMATLATSGCSKKPAPKPLPDNPDTQAATVMPPRMVIGYYENPYPGTPDQTGSFPSMKTFSKSMSTVGPFWYRVTNEGTLEAKDSQLVQDTAKQLGLKIIPLVTNKTGATEAILGDPDVRSKAVANIIKVVKDKQYDGVNIDFELLPAKYRENLTAFMAELYPQMQALNKMVIISVFPQVEVTPDVAGAYDYPQLAKHADFLQIMTYDHHWATSPPGALAPIDWYEKNIKSAIEQSGGPHKVIVGVGAYGYDWPTSGEAATVKYVDAIVTAEKNDAKIEYDEDVQAPHYKYKGHEVWFEDIRSTKAKLDLVAKYNPAGIAIWRLGQEQPEIWQAIDEKFPRAQ